MKEYIITFKKEVDVGLIELYGGKIKYNYTNFPEKASIFLTEEHINDLSLNENVVKIEETTKIMGSGINYSGWNHHWRLAETDTFHKQGYTGKGVKIAILDTGIGSHSLLPTIPSVRWKDFVNGQTSPYDDAWHGTFISGIVHRNAPDAILYVGKVLNSTVDGTTSDAIAGIDWAISQGVDIINFSITVATTDTTIRDACRSAYNAGITVVACTGNGTNTTNPWRWDWSGRNYVYSPANDYSTIGVGACDVYGNETPYSNWGTGLDILAPGGLNTTVHEEQLVSTAPNDTYYGGYGTSFAVAFVVAHCACLMEKYPSYSRSAIKNKLLDTARNGVLRAEPLWDSKRNITGNSVEIMIRYLSYSTNQYGGFRVRPVGTTNWITFPSATYNYTDSYNGYSRQYYTSPYLTISDLQPNTLYNFEVEVNWNGTWYPRQNIIITTTITSLWEWTAQERNILTNKGLLTSISYLRWNQLVDKIYEASNNNWLTSTAYGANLSYTSTKMTSNDKVLTADRFNSVRYNIGARNPTGINRVYKNDNVYGSYFITLETKLNQWISST